MEYKYDVFLSWTMDDVKIKDRIKEALIDSGIEESRIFDSSMIEKCNPAQFEKDCKNAVESSKVMIAIITEKSCSKDHGKYTLSEHRIAALNDGIIHDNNGELRGLNFVPFILDEITKINDSLVFGVQRCGKEKSIYYPEVGSNPENIKDEMIKHVVVRTEYLIKKRNENQPEGAFFVPILNGLSKTSCSYFVDRENERSAIKEKLMDSHPCAIILYGKPGIGKTEIAKKICNEWGVDFSYLVVNCDGTFKNFVENLSFDSVVLNETDKLFDYNLNLLRRIDKKIVIIIKTANSNYEKIYEELINENNYFLFNSIITGRKDMKRSEKLQGFIYKIEEIDTDSILTMFQKILNEKYRENSKNVYEDLIEHAGHNTLICGLIAKFLKEKEGATPEALLEYLQNGGSLSEEFGEDNITMDEYLYRLFSQNEEQDKREKVMMKMSLVTTDGIKKDLFDAIFERLNMGGCDRPIRSLISEGWIVDEGKIQLNKMVSDMFFRRIKKSNMTNIVKYMFDKIIFCSLFEEDEEGSYLKCQENNRLVSFLLIRLCQLKSSLKIKVDDYITTAMIMKARIDLCLFKSESDSDVKDYLKEIKIGIGNSWDSLFIEAIKRIEKDNHQQLCEALYYLSIEYTNRSAYDCAIEKLLLMEKELKSLDESNMKKYTIRFYMKMGLNMTHKNDFDKAMEYLEKGKELANGSDNLLEIATINYYLGGTYRNFVIYLKRDSSFYLKSKEAYLTAEKIYKEMKSTINLIKLYNRIAYLYSFMDEEKENALGVIEQSFKLMKKEFKTDNHPYVAFSHYYKAQILLNLGKYSEAIDEHKKALDIRRFIYRFSSVPHSDVEGSLYYLGFAYEKNKEIELAFNCYEEAYAMCLEIYGDGHRNTNQVKKALERLNR